MFPLAKLVCSDIYNYNSYLTFFMDFEDKVIDHILLFFLVSVNIDKAKSRATAVRYVLITLLRLI